MQVSLKETSKFNSLATHKSNERVVTIHELTGQYRMAAALHAASVSH